MVIQPIKPTEDQLWRHSSRLKSAREKMNAIIAADDVVKDATPSEEYKRTIKKVWPEDEKDQYGYALYEDENGATFWVLHVQALRRSYPRIHPKEQRDDRTNFSE